jgi:hypothetical protein
LKHQLPSCGSDSLENIETDLINALAGNGSVNSPTQTVNNTAEVFYVVRATQQ